MRFQYFRKQRRALTLRHPREAHRVDRRLGLVERFSGPADRVLKHTKGRAPGGRITIREMCLQRTDRRRHQLGKRGVARFGLRRFARPASEVAACAAGFAQFGGR